eukprot:TRINITY_DN65_c0_g1_i2.p1 TRINITY_DN65_c0_g1~~TRINITY_DN65_c0_g1_i2.p1  ORF type:complete len:111 (+),score=37.43 TRINITY_DN65_c0_g1_i2:89-421(+)
MEAPAVKQLTLEEARQAIAAVQRAFDEPENAAKMAAAKAEAGDDIAKNMQLVLPVAMAIQQNVISSFGYEPNQIGVMQFTAAVRAHAADSEISSGLAALTARFMPKLPSA